MKLLTAKDVAEQLRIKPRTVRSLGLPVVAVGRLLRYRQEDLDRYVASQTIYSGGQINGSGKKTKGRIAGLSVLPTRQMLQRVRLSGPTGGEGSGGPKAH